MLPVKLLPNKSGPLRLLCLGAHSDDIEIGCGGAVLKLIQEHPETEIRWIVFSSNKARSKEAVQSAASFLKGSSNKVTVKTFRDGFFPFVGAEIKDCFEELKSEFSPDVVFTHYGADAHQDHRMISQLTWNTFRSHLILEYEIPKYDGDFGSPNFFVPLSKSICATKVRYLMEHFSTQRNKHWFSEDLFYSTLRIRGMEANSPTQFAEGFYVRKVVLS